MCFADLLRFQPEVGEDGFEQMDGPVLVREQQNGEAPPQPQPQQVPFLSIYI